MQENFSGSPFTNGLAVTPADSTNIGSNDYGYVLYIGTAGDLVVETIGGQDLTYANVAVGWFPVRVRKVKEATTADDIVAHFYGV